MHTVEAFLGETARKIKITRIPVTSSTNADMKKAAIEGAPEGEILIAEKQTEGRGRLGRSFYSPEDTGCYMSILLRPELSPEKASLLTPMAAVAVAVAIERVYGERAQIKWVNDVYLHGKKIAGILTEAAFSQGKTDYAIIGIGVNLTEPEGGFPEELSGIAGAIGNGDKEKSNELISEIIKNIFAGYEAIEERPFAQEYRRRLFLLGREINVYSQSGTYQAKALDIDDMFNLVVELHDGETKKLCTGEVSVKG